MGLIRRTDRCKNVAGRCRSWHPPSQTVAVFSVLSALCGLIPDSELWEAFQRDRAWFWTHNLVAGESKSIVPGASRFKGRFQILGNPKKVISTPHHSVLLGSVIRSWVLQIDPNFKGHFLFIVSLKKFFLMFTSHTVKCIHLKDSAR